jgi:hypothetical protein
MNRNKSTLSRLCSWCATKARAACDIALLACALAACVLLGLWRLCHAALRSVKGLPAWLRRKSPRMSLPTILATVLVLAVAAIAPHQAPVLMYKLGGVAAGGCLGYLLDVAAFPYAKPSGYLRFDWRDAESFADDEPDYGIVPGYMWAFMFACLRRAAIVCACMLAVALAL